MTESFAVSRNGINGATIYHVLGILLHTRYKTQDGRPVELVPEGKPVRQLVG